MVNAVIAMLFAIPFFAHADQISDLQGTVRVLQEQLAAIQQRNMRSGTIAVPTVSVSCESITSSLDVGSKGQGVTELQTFLAAVGFFSHEVTGYYGPVTMAAVQQFQKNIGIASAGTPSSTGYGRVGPKTLAAIQGQCNIGEVGAFMQVSPTNGKTPLYVTVQATVNTTNSCVPATYKLDWGDQSEPISIGVRGGICQPLQQTYTHTYTTPAAYEIILSSGNHSTQATVVAQR